jgi:hypothetical protein
MSSMRYVRTAAASTVLCFGGIAFAATEKTDNNQPVIFVQSAPKASIKDGKLTLMSPSTTFHTASQTGHMPCSKFIETFSNGDKSLKSDPPKATLSAFVPNGEPKKMSVALRNPRFDGPNLVYDVSILNGTAPEGMQEAALIMDDVRLANAGNCTIYNCEVNGG